MLDNHSLQWTVDLVKMIYFMYSLINMTLHIRSFFAFPVISLTSDYLTQTNL